MIETCKDCRHCKLMTHTERVWDKYGLNTRTWYTYFCEKLKMEVPPINRCKYINEPIKVITRHDIVEICE